MLVGMKIEKASVKTKSRNSLKLKIVKMFGKELRKKKSISNMYVIEVSKKLSQAKNYILKSSYLADVSSFPCFPKSPIKSPNIPLNRGGT